MYVPSINKDISDLTYLHIFKCITLKHCNRTWYTRRKQAVSLDLRCIRDNLLWVSLQPVYRSPGTTPAHHLPVSLQKESM